MTEEKKTELREYQATVTGRFASRAPAERMTVPGVAILTQSLASQVLAGRVARQMVMFGDMGDVLNMNVVDYAELERRGLAYYGDGLAADLAKLLDPDPTEIPRPDDEAYVREGRNEANRTQRRAERRYLEMNRPKGNRR